MLKTGPVWALGSMSGTSLDGVDAAMVLTDGDRIFEFGRSAYRPYDEAERAVLRAALGLWDGPQVDAAARVVERAHAELLAGFPEAEIVGFHGQTLAHDPRGRGTLQVGSGEWLAKALDRNVVWDFRTHDVKNGGQGAPLAPFFHHACARWMGGMLPLAFVNLGGVGNLTWVDPRQTAPDAAGALVAFDTGPANAPINDLMRARLGRDVDMDGALAAAGRVEDDVLSTFIRHAYFDRIPPKSLDRNDFHDLLDMVGHLPDADACATLTRCAVEAVAVSLQHAPVSVDRVLVTGGGRKNRTMMEMLAQRLPVEVHAVEDVDLDGDMLEAQAFAYLAVRAARGMTLSAPMTTGVPVPTTGGKVARPPR